MTATRRELVLAAVARSFSEAERDRALEVLDTYGLEPHEREVERVQLAILNLCGGDLDRLKHFVEVAKMDHRDVLFWAE